MTMGTDAVVRPVLAGRLSARASDVNVYDPGPQTGSVSMKVHETPSHVPLTRMPEGSDALVPASARARRFSSKGRISQSPMQFVQTGWMGCPVDVVDCDGVRVRLEVCDREAVMESERACDIVELSVDVMDALCVCERVCDGVSDRVPL